MSVKACRQELPNKGVKLTALRAAAYAQNVRPSNTMRRAGSPNVSINADAHIQTEVSCE